MRETSNGSFKQGDSSWVNFLLLDNAELPVIGLTFGNISNVKYLRQPDAAWNALTLTAFNFSEVGDGLYRIMLDPTVLAHIGNLSLFVQGPAFDDIVIHADVMPGNPGNVQTTITINDSTLPTPNPLSLVSVEIWDDLQTSIVWYGNTNESGQAVLALSPGSYKVVLKRDRTTFSVPESLLVIGPVPFSVTYVGVELTLPIPSGPGKCVVFFDPYDISGDIDDGISPDQIIGTVIRAKRPNVVSGRIYTIDSINKSANTAGRIEIELAQGLGVTFRVPRCGIDKTFTVPAQASLDLATVV